jgi:hypothetical protein
MTSSTPPAVDGATTTVPAAGAEGGDADAARSASAVSDATRMLMVDYLSGVCGGPGRMDRSIAAQEGRKRGRTPGVARSEVVGP